MQAVEDDFKKLKEAGTNTVVGLIKWMVEAHIIEDALETKQKVEKMFHDVTDKSNVEYAKFLQVVTAIVTERHENTEQAFKKLVDVLTVGVTAFIEAVKKEHQAPAPSTSE